MAVEGSFDGKSTGIRKRSKYQEKGKEDSAHNLELGCTLKGNG